MEKLGAQIWRCSYKKGAFKLGYLHYPKLTETKWKVNETGLWRVHMTSKTTYSIIKVMSYHNLQQKMEFLS